jgi:hypothetical protein
LPSSVSPLATVASAREPAPLWIVFTDAELQRAKRAALRAINAPHIWERFPKQRHERRYKPLPREISYGFSQTKDGNTCS